MAVISITGPPGCRVEEVARLAAQRLDLQVVTESALRKMLCEEFGSESAVPDKAYPQAVAFLLARLARERHLAVCAPGAEFVVPQFPGSLRVSVQAPEAYRVGALMLDHRLDRPAALSLLRQLDRGQRTAMKKRFGRKAARPEQYDIVANAATLQSEQIVDLLEGGAYVQGLLRHGLLSPQLEAEIQFQARLFLAKHNVLPVGRASLSRKQFAHPSEEVFANLLDFYRISWEYESKSFPIQWDNQGRATELFTPDFYLPDFDLYVELTTMKQANVTRKNRKVKLLRTIYPQINIQVFYQKDFQNLIFKYGLAERAHAV
jgi:cytidylate kinase